MLAISKAEDLAAHTINLCSNERHFPKRKRWLYADRIVGKALEVNTLIHEANAIYPSDKSRLRLRLEYEDRALASIAGLYSLVAIAKRTSDLSLDSVEHWLSLIEEERKLLQGMRSADREKLPNLPD